MSFEFWWVFKFKFELALDLRGEEGEGCFKSHHIEASIEIQISMFKLDSFATEYELALSTTSKKVLNSNFNRPTNHNSHTLRLPVAGRSGHSSPLYACVCLQTNNQQAERTITRLRTIERENERRYGDTQILSGCLSIWESQSHNDH